MFSTEPLRDGLHNAWDSLAEGWSHLRQRAGQALTRFTRDTRGEVITAEDNLADRSTRWSLLAAEVTEHDNELMVKLEVPGMDAGDFDIEVVGNDLRVSGEKQVERRGKVGRYHVTERAYGRFQRVIPLPVEIDDSAAKADYRRGVLTVTLVKRGDKVYVQAGAGIVADSQPATEYRECFNKARALAEAIKLAETDF